MAVLAVISTMVLIMGAVFYMTTGEARLMQHDLDRYTAIAYADGVVESLFDQWRAAMTSSTNLSSTQKRYGPTGNELQASPFSVSAPSSSILPVPAGMTLSSWTLTAADPYGNALSGTSRPTLENGTNSSLLIRMYYIGSATVSFRHGGTVTVQRIFTRAGTNIFNNFLYSAQPITEIDPGAPMNVNGTIYASGSLFMFSNQLNLQQDVSYTSGTWSSNPSPSDGRGVTGASPSYPSADPPHLGASQNLIDVVTSLLDQNFVSSGNYYDPGVYSSTNSTTQNLNNKGYHELIEQQKSPVSSNPDPLALDTAGDSERLANNADYVITVDGSNNVNIYSGTNTTPLTYTGTTSQYYYIASALITNTAFYDGRVGDTVRALTVDVGKLATAYNNNQITDSNVYEGQSAKDGLLIYIVDTSAVNATITSSTATISGTSVTTNGYNYLVTSPTNGLRTTGTVSGTAGSHVTSSFARGIRLVNGGVLPTGTSTGNTTGGLTIASPNPVYIQGDYNTGSTSGSFTSSGYTVSNQPTSNSGSSAYPSGTSNPNFTSGTYNRQASVIAADAVTILSNSWSDANSNSGYTNRTPTNTTINTAIVAGNVPTAFEATYFPNANGSTAYSGGIENFPRLLENWGSGNSGNYLTIHGSFALLYNSEQAIQPWQNTGNYYNAPKREWFFDSVLQNYNPPGFPAAYTYSRGLWSTQ